MQTVVRVQKTPTMVSAVLRLMRVGNPTSIFNRKTIAAADKIAKDLVDTVRDIGHIEVGRAVQSLGTCPVCMNQARWELVWIPDHRDYFLRHSPSNRNEKQFVYGSQKSSNFHGAFHLAQALYREGGYDNWAAKRLQALRTSSTS